MAARQSSAHDLAALASYQLIHYCIVRYVPDTGGERLEQVRQGRRSASMPVQTDWIRGDSLGPSVV